MAKKGKPFVLFVSSDSIFMHMDSEMENTVLKGCLFLYCVVITLLQRPLTFIVSALQM